jgi:arylsulfatase A-like enzyme
MNVALVVLDTLRFDTFREQFDWLSGIRFTNAWATSHWTVPVHASLFAGKYPSELGVHVDNQSLDCPEPVIAEQLSEAGYTTRAFASNIILARPFGFDRGFDEYTGTWKFRALSGDVFDWEAFTDEPQGPAAYARAGWDCLVEPSETWPSLVRGARVALDRVDEPPGHETRAALDYIQRTEVGDREFLFVNLMNAHMPHTPPESYRTAEADEPYETATEYNGLVATAGDGPDTDPSVLRQAYDDSVRYLSDVYREMHEELLADFDVVVTISDHGELFGEHDVWQHSYGVYPELAHVPCVISGDGIDDATRTEPISLLDIHRTLLDLAGIKGESRGNGLLDASGPTVTADPTPRDCLVEYLGPNPRNREKVGRLGYDPTRFDDELFGIAAGSSYGYETIDDFRVAGDADESTLRDRLAELRAGIDRRDARSEREVSAATRRQLERLGYA